MSTGLVLAAYTQNVTVDGEAYTVLPINITANIKAAFSVSVPPAIAGTLTTHTSSSAGTFTLPVGHGITTGQTNVFAFWLDPTSGLPLCARLGTVGTVSGQLVPVTGFVGDALPVVTTPVTFAVGVTVPFNINGTNAQLLQAWSGAIGSISFFASSTEVVNYHTVKNASALGWVAGNGFTSPITGSTLTSVVFCHSDSVTTQQMKGVSIA